MKRALAHFDIIPSSAAALLSEGVVKLDTIDTRPSAWSPADAEPATLDTVDDAAGAVGAGAGDAAVLRKDKASSGHLQSQNCTPVAGLWRSNVQLWDKVKLRASPPPSTAVHPPKDAGGERRRLA